MKGKSKKTFAILISAIMGISSLSMDTSPLMAKEREQYVLTEDNHSKTEHSNWLQSIRTFNKERQNDQEQREDGIYFDPPSFLEPSPIVKDEFGIWRYQASASPEVPFSQEQLLDELPVQVTIVLNGQEQVIDLDPSWWDLSLFGPSQYEGEYKIVLNIPTEYLPEGYAQEPKVEVFVQMRQEDPQGDPIDPITKEDGIYLEGTHLIQEGIGTWRYPFLASEEEPLFKEQLLDELPVQVTIVLNGQEHKIAIDPSWWDLSAFGSSRFEGEYRIVLNIPLQSLPEGYEDQSEIAVVVQITKDENLEDKVLKEDGIYFDGSNLVQDEKGVWKYQTKATQEAPLSQDQLLNELPIQLAIVFNGQEHKVVIDPLWWDLSAFGQSQYEGEYKIVLNIPTESLPEGYDLTKPIEVLVQFEQATITEEQLQAHELKTTVSPRGTTIDLFNYPDNLEVGQFEFNGGGGSIDANKWTGILGEKGDRPLNQKRAMQNLVQPTLDDGYPHLLANGNPNLEGLKTTGITQETSLAPLFDGTYPGVRGAQGLLQVDQQGYFYYNSKQNYATLEKTENGYGNRFKVYDVPRNIKDNNIAGNIQDPNYNLQGQFFPFNPAIYKTTNGEVKSIFNENNGQLENNYTNENRTYHFGVHMSTRFIHENGGYTDSNQTTPVTYEFSGDDDVWVFIDGVLVGDVGGIHDAISLEINFATGNVVVFSKQADGSREEVKTTLKDCYGRANKTIKWVEAGNGQYTFENNSYHTLDFFYLERGKGASNMQLKYNLLEVPESSIIKQDQIGQAVPGAEFELWSGKGQEQKDTLLAKGTTNHDGTFILMDARVGHENKILSLKELYEDGFRELTLRETKIPDGYRGQVNVPLKLVENSETKGVTLVNEDPWSTGVYASPKVRTEIPPTAYIYTAGQIGKPVTLEEQKNGIVFAVLQKRVHQDKSYDDPSAWVPIYGDREHGWHMIQTPGNVLEDVVLAFKKQIDQGYQSQIFSLSANGVMAVEIDDLPGDVQTYYSMLPNEQKYKTEYALGYYYSSSPTIDGVDHTNTWRLDSDAALAQSNGQNFGRFFATHILVPNIKNTLYVQKTDENGNLLVDAQFSLYTQDQVKEENGVIQPIDPAIAYDTITIQQDGVIENVGSFPSGSKNTILKEGTYYLIEDRAPDGYIRNPHATKIIVNSQGVYANAGKEQDGIVVARGVGGVLKSMSQFATEDEINKTLSSIRANMEITDSEQLDFTHAKLGGSPKEIHLEYNADDRVLQYGAIETEDNPNREIQIQTDTGWSKLNIYQCLENHGIEAPDHSSIENLGNKEITNLFSNTVTVIVENEQTNPLSIEKIVEDVQHTAKVQPYTFDVQLSYGPNQTPVSGTYPITITTKTEGQNPVVETGKSIQFDSEGKASVELQAGWNEQGQNVLQKVAIINLPLGIQYTIAETTSGQFTTKVKSDTQSQMNANTISGMVEKTEDHKFKNSEITFINTYTHFEFIKVNKEGNPLQDVLFGLYEFDCQDPNHNDTHHDQLLKVDLKTGDLIDPQPCWKKVGTFSSDAQGKVTLSNLVEGKKYRLVELKTAPGYILAQGQWTIQENQDQQFAFGQSIGNPPAVEFKEGKNYLYNYKPHELPLTGDQGNTSFMIWGTALMFFAVVLWMISQKRRVTK